MEKKPFPFSVCAQCCGGEVSPEQIAQGVEEYLEDNPITAEDVGTYNKQEIEDKIRDHHLVVTITVDGNVCIAKTGSYNKIKEAYQRGAVVSLCVFNKGDTVNYTVAQIAEVNRGFITFYKSTYNTLYKYDWEVDDTIDINSIPLTTQDDIDSAIGDIDSALDELHNYALALIGGASE